MNNQDNRTGHTPPHNHDAEQATLGAMLRNEEAIGDVCEVFSAPSCFYSPSHRKIFEAIITLHEKRRLADITTVADEMEKNGDLEDCGGRLYLSELASGMATAANATHYANLVFEKSQLRRLITASAEITAECYRQDDDPDKILDRAEGRIYEISEVRPHDDFMLLSASTGDVFEQINEARETGRGLSGVSTGFTDLDEMLSGLKKGDLYILAGRPSMGKSSCAMNIAENVDRAYNDSIREMIRNETDADKRRDLNKQLQGIAFFSLEMTRQQLNLRELGGLSGINSREAEKGRVNDSDWGKLIEASAKISDMRIFVDASSTITPIQMRRKLRRLSAKSKIGLVIVDYMQLMDCDGKGENRQQEITKISRALKAIAKDHNVPVIALSQLSRQVEMRGGDHRPQLSDLRESGAIEQDADAVLFVYRAEYYMGDLDPEDPKRLAVKGITEVIISKQRTGPTGTVKLLFRKGLTRFENLAKPDRFQQPANVTGERENDPF